jgi:hypothetical protein
LALHAAAGAAQRALLSPEAWQAVALELNGHWGNCCCCCGCGHRQSRRTAALLSVMLQCLLAWYSERARSVLHALNAVYEWPKCIDWQKHPT